MISAFVYSLKQGIKSLYKNSVFTLASIGTIVACLFLFGILVSVGLNFQYMMQRAEKKVGISVFFDEGLKQKEIDDIGRKIDQIDGVVERKFISATEAWRTFSKEIFGNEKEVLEGFGDDNPLADSASYEVHLRDLSIQPQVVKQIKGITGVRKVTHSKSTAEGITNLNLFVGYASGAIVVILLGVAIFLISNTITIGITVRKEEIAIMKLIGATDFFVRAPFVIEGLIIGIIGSIIPMGIFYFVYDRVTEFIVGRYQLIANLLTFLPTNEVFFVVAPISLFIGIGIGLLGSYITLFRHLKV